MHSTGVYRHKTLAIPMQSTSPCLHFQQREQIIGFVTPAASQILQQLRFETRPSLLLDFVVALEWIPHKGETLECIADKELLEQLCESNAAGAFTCPYCDRSYQTFSGVRTHFPQHNGPLFLCAVPKCRANVGELADLKDLDIVLRNSVLLAKW
ncbi:hypothetical protein FHL15_008035 [Xylaria flabelliformis]|uniref:C2H2-type domain-containing protein n=1 Tax=Xylaria flabelliformis TaxID=2512241 RepID=A0A553HSX9_9PEZI|nr:hypothetical protein FHL15_008035 [Xylaria flabelliformis]